MFTWLEVSFFESLMKRSEDCITSNACNVVFFSRGFKWHVGQRSKITMPPKPTFYFIIWDTVFFKIVLFSNDLFYVNYLLYFPLKERLNFILMNKLYWFYLSLYLPYLNNIVSNWIIFVLKTFLCFVFIKVLKLNHKIKQLLSKPLITNTFQCFFAKIKVKFIVNQRILVVTCIIEKWRPV